MTQPEKPPFLDFLAGFNDPHERYIDTTATPTEAIKDAIRESISRSDGRRPTSIQIKNGTVIDFSIERQISLKARFDIVEGYREEFFERLDRMLAGAEMIIFIQEQPLNR